MVKTGWQQNCRPVLREENEKERNDVKNWKNILAVLLIGMTAAFPALAQKKTKKASSAQTVPSQPGSPRMQFMGKFDAGVPNAGIYKMYDASDDVVCYILMPDLPVTKKIPQGVMYEGNSIGAISCLKVRVHVVPISGR